jgi:hypothetical protein
MNIKKKIEQPLKEKILINEERIRSLFNFKLDDEKTESKNQNNSIVQSDSQMKKESMEFEILSKSNMSKNPYNNNSLNPNLTNDNLISISISTRNNESLSAINNKHKNKIKQRNPTNSNFNHLKKSDKSIGKISNTINYNYNYSYNSYNNNNYNFTFTTRKNKKNLIQSIGLKKNIKNYDTYRNYYCNISNLNQSQPLNNTTKPKQSVNLNKMLERFEENERKKKEKIEKLKREKEEKELEQCFYKPLLNKKSLNINKRLKNDFLTRQQIYNQKVKEKEKKIKRDLSQKKDKDKKYLPIKKHKETSSIINDFLNTSLKSELGSDDQKTVNINDTINKLYEWEQRRKEKIEKKREEKECEKEDSGDHIPTIGKRSSSLANRRKVKKEYNDNIFERLYKEDDILKEKRELMVQLTKPSFEPNLNLARKYKFEDLTEEKYINDITHYYNNEFVNEIITYMNKNFMSTDDKISNKDLQDDEIKQLYRKAIIDKMRKNFRMKSEEKRKAKKYHHM